MPEVTDNAVLPSRGTFCTHVGTSGTETITGSSGDDRICPMAGNDTVFAGAGDDVIYTYSGTTRSMARKATI